MERLEEAPSGRESTLSQEGTSARNTEGSQKPVPCYSDEEADEDGEDLDHDCLFENRPGGHLFAVFSRQYIRLRIFSCRPRRSQHGIVYRGLGKPQVKFFPVHQSQGYIPKRIERT